LIAADVNADDDIKASDLVELRKLILGVTMELPTSESWRFIDASEDLSMEMNLEDVPYVTNIYDLQTSLENTDFIGVKVGDVTNNATTNLQGSAVSEVRSNKAVRLSMLDEEVQTGELYTVEFTSENFREVYGYQFTMELSGLEYVGVESGAIEMTNGNVGRLSTGIVTMSYHNSEAVTTGIDEGVFSVTFKATRNGKLSDMIEITSKVTPAEAYLTTSYEVMNVELATRGLDIEVSEAVLYQNEPNPFKGQTTIGFDLVESAAATLTINDVTGQVIMKKNIDGLKGYNSVTLRADQLGVSGLLYYTIESGEFTSTKKMIIIK